MSWCDDRPFTAPCHHERRPDARGQVRPGIRREIIAPAGVQFVAADVRYVAGRAARDDTSASYTSSCATRRRPSPMSPHVTGRSGRAGATHKAHSEVLPPPPRKNGRPNDIALRGCPAARRATVVPAAPSAGLCGRLAASRTITRPRARNLCAASVRLAVFSGNGVVACGLVSQPKWMPFGPNYFVIGHQQETQQRPHMWYFCITA